MAKLTKDDVEKIKAELGLPWGRVALRCDGFRVTVAVTEVGALKYVLRVFVNGWLHASQVLDDCEERRRFMRPSLVRLYPPAKRQALVKQVGIRLAKKMGADATLTVYSHHWNSARVMLRHFLANNENVELVGVGYAALLENECTKERPHA